MKIVFELRKEKIAQNGLIPIQLVVRHDGKRIRKNTGLSVLESHWNGHRVKPNLKKEPNNNYEITNNELQLNAGVKAPELNKSVITSTENMLSDTIAYYSNTQH